MGGGERITVGGYEIQNNAPHTPLGHLVDTPTSVGHTTEHFCPSRDSISNIGGYAGNLTFAAFGNHIQLIFPVP